MYYEIFNVVIEVLQTPQNTSHSPLAQGQEAYLPIVSPDRLPNPIYEALFSLTITPAYSEVLNIYDVILQSSIFVSAVG